MISGETMVYFGPEPWGGMWRNRHQLLRRVAPANTVVYVEPRPYIDELTARLRRGLTRRPVRRRRAAGGCKPMDLSHTDVRSIGRAAPGARRDPLAAAPSPITPLSQVGVRRPIHWISTPAQLTARLTCLPGCGSITSSMTIWAMPA